MNPKLTLLFVFGLLMACSVPPQQGAVIQAKLTVNPGFSTKAAPSTTSDVDHYTYKLRDNGTNAVIGTFTSGSTSFTFTGVVGGVYKLTAEAFSSSNDTTSITQGGEATSSNTVTVSGAGVNYSSGGALAATLNLLSGNGETIKAAVNFGGSPGDVDHFIYELVRTSDSQVIDTANSSASALLFNQINSGTYKLRARGYDAGNNPVTVAADSPNTVTISSSGVSYSSGLCLSSSLNTSNNWGVGLAVLPTTRRQSAVAAVGGKVYVIGGYNGTYLQDLYAYDPVANTWTAKANPPQQVCKHEAVALNGKVYSIGGYRNQFGDFYYNNLEMYDPGTNAWTGKASMAENKANFAAAVVSGKIYSFAGRNSNFLVGAGVEEYDPVGNAWTSKLPMPVSSEGHSAAAVNGKVYIFGGSLGTTTYEYDPVGNTYATKAAMTANRTFMAVGVVNDLIYAIGGTGPLSVVEMYDPVANTWATKAGMPTARMRLGAGVVGSSIFAIGGDNGGYLDTVERYDP